MPAESHRQPEEKLVRLPLLLKEALVRPLFLSKEAAVFLTIALIVASLLWIVYWLPPSVKEPWKMSVTSHPITWLTSNYVHEDWGHFISNLLGYIASIVVYVTLLPMLRILGYDFRRVNELGVAIHVSALVVAPLASAAAWLVASFYLPQVASFKFCGFSTSVSAYVGADIALWAIVIAKTFNVDITLTYLLLQLLLFLLVPASRYLSRSIQWLAAASPYIWAIAATLLAIRNPKNVKNATRIIHAKEPEKARITNNKVIRILFLLYFLLFYLLFYPSAFAFMLDSLYPVTFIYYNEKDKILIGVVSHLVGTLVGYASLVITLLLFNVFNKLKTEGRGRPAVPASDSL